MQSTAWLEMRLEKDQMVNYGCFAVAIPKMMKIRSLKGDKKGLIQSIIQSSINIKAHIPKQKNNNKKTTTKKKKKKEKQNHSTGDQNYFGQR